MDRKVNPEESAASVELIVLGSGNLGLVYVPGPERLSLEEIERRWPALVPGLVQHPGIGFVAALGADGPVAIGPRGDTISRPVPSKGRTRWRSSGRMLRSCS